MRRRAASSSTVRVVLADTYRALVARDPDYARASAVGWVELLDDLVAGRAVRVQGWQLERAGTPIPVDDHFAVFTVEADGSITRTVPTRSTPGGP